MTHRTTVGGSGRPGGDIVRAEDIMSSPVHTVRQTASVLSAAQLMAAEAVTVLPVVDRMDVLIGMVSARDLVWHRGRAGWGPAERPTMVREIMSPYPVTTRPDADVADVAEVMLGRDVRSIPVLDGGMLVGIISRGDVLRAVIRGDDVLAHEIRRRLGESAHGRQRWTVTVHRGVARLVGDPVDDIERAEAAVLARTVPGVAEVHVVTP